MRIILDTNCVLDFLLFEDPNTQRFREKAQRGELIIISDDNCFNEFKRVLDYPRLALADSQKIALIQKFEQCIYIFDKPTYPLDTPPPMCRDKDDQKFIDSAIFHHCQYLISRDKQVLKLNKKMRPLGITVCTPVDFASHQL